MNDKEKQQKDKVILTANVINHSQYLSECRQQLCETKLQA